MLTSLLPASATDDIVKVEVWDVVDKGECSGPEPEAGLAWAGVDAARFWGSVGRRGDDPLRLLALLFVNQEKARNAATA